jgi:hypothetical protein
MVSKVGPKQGSAQQAQEERSPWPEGRKRVPQLVLKKGHAVSTVEKLARGEK